MGMLATVINGLAIKQALINANVPVELYSLLEVPKIAKSYQHDEILNQLNNNKVIILAGGTGRPYFSTDTAAAIIACETNANYILMAKDGVDGVYSSDPKKDKNAKHYDFLNYNQIIEKNLKVMDATALTICRDYQVKLIVFDMSQNQGIIKALKQQIKTTLIADKK